MSPEDAARQTDELPVIDQGAGEEEQAPTAATRRSTISVAVINDAELVVCGVAAMLAQFPDQITVVETDANGLPNEAVEVALLDTFAVGFAAVERAETILHHNLAKHIVFFTWDVRRMTAELMDLPRVNGVVSKSVSSLQLVEAVEAVVGGSDVVIHGPTPTGGSDLTPVEPLSARESQVASLMAQGRTNSEIADLLIVSPETVKTYASRLFRKLGARNRAQVAAWVVDGGLSSTPTRDG